MLGLDELTLAAYRRWLRDGGRTAAELGAELAVPEVEVERARGRLVELGLLRPSLERPGTVVAVDPGAVLDRVFRDRQGDLLRVQQELIGALAELPALLADYDRGRRGAAVPETIERVEGPDAVGARLIEVIGAARSTLITVHSPADPVVDPVDTARALGAAVRRGAAVRSVHAGGRAADRRPGPVPVPAPDLRIVDDVPLRLAVADGTLGLVLPARTRGAGSGLLLRGALVTGLLVTVFEHTWARAAPVTAPPPAVAGVTATRDEPDELQRALLVLLAQGFKDEAAARQLGVSVRTVRRLIAELMEALDARSRFQAGALAAARGWL